jgi:hypothetical protein
MQRISSARRVSQIFLWFAPLICWPLLIFAFRNNASHSYLLGGAALAALLFLAAWVLGASTITRKSGDKKWVSLAGLLLIAPIMTVSLFAGLGPPPQEPEKWLATAVDEEIRYRLLLFAGLFAASGFVVLRECVRQAGERIYSALGSAAIIISTALFVLYITNDGTLLEALRYRVSSGKMPDWYAPIKSHFIIVGFVEVALTYLATAAFATALRIVGLLGKTGCRIFQGLSLLAVLSIVLSQLFPGRLLTPAFVLGIPAVPFLMPYFIGVNLLRRAGDSAA